MKKEVIVSKRGVELKGPYSAAIKYGDLLFVAGQGPLDPKTGEVVAGDIETQTARTLEDLKIVLEDAGTSLKNVLNTTVFLADINDFDRMNKVYAGYFGPNFPARTTVQAGRLWSDIKIEIQAVAYISGEEEK